MKLDRARQRSEAVRLGLLLTAILACLGCASTGGGGSGQPWSGSVVTLHRGSADVAAHDVALRSQRELEDLWQKAGLPGEVPDVDFSRNMVLATFRGCRSNACYATRVVSFTPSGAGGTAWIEDVDPSPDCMCAMVVTCPTHIVEVPMAAGEVTFRHRSATKDCPHRRRRP